MTYRALLPLAFILALPACGNYSNLPSPPRTPVDPPAATSVKTAASKTNKLKPQRARASSTMWYERYNPGDGAVIVTMDDGAKGSMGGEKRLNYRQESYENPGLKAYERRLAVLRQEQKRLLEENAQLREELRSASGTTAQVREMRELQSWLAQLSAGQAQVVAQTQTIAAEHGVLLAQLKRTLPEYLVQLEQPFTINNPK